VQDRSFARTSWPINFRKTASGQAACELVQSRDTEGNDRGKRGIAQAEGGSDASGKSGLDMEA
jgi:hypothetical protein